MDKNLSGNRALLALILIILGSVPVASLVKAYLSNDLIVISVAALIWIAFSIYVPFLLIKTKTSSPSRVELGICHLVIHAILFLMIIAAMFGQINLLAAALVSSLLLLFYTVIVRRIHNDLVWYPYQFLDVEQSKKRLKMDIILNVIGSALLIPLFIYCEHINGSATLSSLYNLIFLYYPLYIVKLFHVRKCIRDKEGLTPQPIKFGGIEVV